MNGIISNNIQMIVVPLPSSTKHEGIFEKRDMGQSSS